MRWGKNSVTILLIASSISLLLVLQMLWLSNTYHQEYQRIEKEAHQLFRNLIFDMSDSLMQQNISALPLKRNQLGAKIVIHDSVQVFSRRPFPPEPTEADTLHSNVQVFVYSQSGKDSLKDFIKPLASRIRDTKGRQSFSIRINGESLPKKKVETKYREVLGKAGLPIDFAVDSVNRNLSFPMKMPRLPDDRIIFTPVGGFQVDLQDIRWLVFKRITPQLSFSVILTLLTTLSFWMMWRNIKAQQRLAMLKNDFISNMTHELKTPVTTVGVALEALQNFNGLENKALTQEYLTIAQNELNRLSLLTDKILKTAIFENQGINFQPERVDLEKIVEQVMSSLKLVFEKNKAVTTLEKKGGDFQLLGSTIHLTNVVYNLLDNALKYSAENPTINISLQERGAELILSVQDNGVGISPEYKKRIFEKFFRVPSGDVHNTKGYGLGLSYVESVVKAHGGKIVVESETSWGSTFIIYLPIQNLKFKIQN
jgi:signal transduction histidine kinase